MSNTNIAEPLSKAQKGKPNERPLLIISIDPGASSIKVVGSVAGDDKCCPLIIEPYCVEINDPVPDLNFDQNSVWVNICGISYALGNLAIAKYDCPLEIKPLKIKSIVPKICAAIAILHRKFELAISSVLPPGEYAYADEMRLMLLKALRKIGTPAGVIKPVVRSIDIHSEGFGVMDWHRTIGMGKTRDVGVIMLGFRNASVLFSRRAIDQTQVFQVWLPCRAGEDIRDVRWKLPRGRINCPCLEVLDRWRRVWVQASSHLGFRPRNV
jgi:hypothetical protein